MENLIFVNYRSSDDPFAALLVDKGLTARFGPERVFRDGRTIRPGTRFPPEISHALQQCQVLIAVIGQRWLHKCHAGHRLIDDPTDWVRLEIAEALRRDILLVPVLVGDVTLPPQSLLPPDIAGLATRQYVRLRVRDAEYDIARLVNELADLLGDAGLPVGWATTPARTPEPSRPSATTVYNTFHGPVDARRSVFGRFFGTR